MVDEYERPRSEPEILPPERDRFGRRNSPYAEFRGFHGVHVRPIGPLGIFVGAVGAAIIFAVLALLVAGFFLFVVPAILAVAVISLAVMLLRSSLRRPPGR
jgi:hypothetical protein